MWTCGVVPGLRGGYVLGFLFSWLGEWRGGWRSAISFLASCFGDEAVFLAWHFLLLVVGSFIRRLARFGGRGCPLLRGLCLLILADVSRIGTGLLGILGGRSFGVVCGRQGGVGY